MKIERWAFTPSERKNPAGCRREDEFVASWANVDQGVIVLRDGTVTNRWDDGTAGVPREIQGFAEHFTAGLSRNGEPIDGWYDVIVSNGAFVRWGWNYVIWVEDQKRYAFVEYPTEEKAQRAVAGLQEKFPTMTFKIMRRNLVV
jgi:hypothetical protein